MASTNLLFFFFACSHSPRNEQAVMGRRRIRTRRTQENGIFLPTRIPRRKKAARKGKSGKKVTLRRIRTLGEFTDPPAYYSAAAAGHSIEEKGKENKNNKAHNTHLFSRNTHTHTILYFIPYFVQQTQNTSYQVIGSYFLG